MTPPVTDYAVLEPIGKTMTDHGPWVLGAGAMVAVAVTIFGVILLAGLKAMVTKMLVDGKVLTKADLDAHLAERMRLHEEWEQRLNAASRDVVKDLIESYHRQTIADNEHARKLAVAVANDNHSLRAEVIRRYTELDRRMRKLEGYTPQDPEGGLS